MKLNNIPRQGPDCTRVRGCPCQFCTWDRQEYEKIMDYVNAHKRTGPHPLNPGCYCPPCNEAVIARIFG